MEPGPHLRAGHLLLFKLFVMFMRSLPVRLVLNTISGYFERLMEAITIFLMVSLALVVLIAVAYRLGGHSLAW